MLSLKEKEEKGAKQEEEDSSQEPQKNRMYGTDIDKVIMTSTLDYMDRSLGKDGTQKGGQQCALNTELPKTSDNLLMCLLVKQQDGADVYIHLDQKPALQVFSAHGWFTHWTV